MWTKRRTLRCTEVAARCKSRSIGPTPARPQPDIAAAGRSLKCGRRLPHQRQTHHGRKRAGAAAADRAELAQRHRLGYARHPRNVQKRGPQHRSAPPYDNLQGQRLLRLRRLRFHIFLRIFSFETLVQSSPCRNRRTPWPAPCFTDGYHPARRMGTNRRTGADTRRNSWAALPQSRSAALCQMPG